MFQKPGFSEKPGFFSSKLHWLSLPIQPMHLVYFLCHAIFTRSVEPLSNITRFVVVISIFGVSETKGARLHLRASCCKRNRAGFAGDNDFSNEESKRPLLAEKMAPLGKSMTYL